MKQKVLTFGLTLLLGAIALPVMAQVSNDNEDGVNRVDQRFARDFVPGQVLVKFKDESSIQVQRSPKGQFRAASINRVDQLLRNYGVKDMEKLFPAEVAKPKSKLRRKMAPNGIVVQEKNLDKVYWVKTNIERSDSTMQLIEELKALPEVEYAEPNYKVYITADISTGLNNEQPQRHFQARVPVVTETTATTICPNPSRNPLYFRQYGITQQNIHKLWNKPIINKKRPVIAILDTGIDISHPDLQDNIWTNIQEADGEKAYDDDGNGIVDDVHGWNFIDNYYETPDRNGHGTHVAGIAAAADNNIGIIGANPLALIMPIKVMNDRGEGDDATIARGIAYAANNGADIINMSLGGPDLSSTMKDAIDNAYQSAIIVASAGNNGVDIYTNRDGCYGTIYPAAYNLVLGVEASGSNLQRASFSNYDPDGPIYSEDGVDGRNYEVQVPGDKIYSTLPGGKYNQLSGTSMSAPLLAGAISALQMVKDYPSKDVLFGDLIHFKANFEKIYSDDEPRMPKIDLVSLNVDDDVEGNSNIDGQIDVGETIKFTPVLRNTWAEATDISIQLAVDPLYANVVEIENPEVLFGYSLSAYGSSPAQTPIRVHFANDIGGNSRIKFTLTVNYAEGAESFTQDVYVTVNNMVKIGGLITEDRTLTADHVYYVNDNIGIMEGATLTIEPGTRLEFAHGMGISSYGKLVAKGTPGKPIVFTSHSGAEFWNGIVSHKSTGEILHDNRYLYTNSDSTLFTLLPTDQTPNAIQSFGKSLYYNSHEIATNPQKDFRLADYVDGWEVTGSSFSVDLTSNIDQLTNPDYITPYVNQMITDYKYYISQYAFEYEKDGDVGFWVGVYFPSWKTFSNPRDTITYCILDNYAPWKELYYPYMMDCIIMQNVDYHSAFFRNLSGKRNYINGLNIYGSWNDLEKDLEYSNIVNFAASISTFNESSLPKYSQLSYNNYINNYAIASDRRQTNYGKEYRIGIVSSLPTIDHSEKPSYLGSSSEEFIRQFVYEIGNDAPDTYGQIDLSNMPTRPYAEAHGIVWKVVVNGKDAQDEYEDLAPLGVGKHKFEVYFNRPMNKEVAPQISFGVRDPWTQNPVIEEGEGSGWNEEGTIYTAYKTISGRTQSDGVNRIYVYGAEDNEYFEIPYEKTRFNIQINAAGSMATGFAAEAGLGRVDLTWNNENNDFDDAMGFNVYRYELDGEGNEVNNTRLNTEILDIETTSYPDYAVVPGTTYYYMYKVLSTDLKEYDVSNVVAATPLTATKGDANGSGAVDVGDVVSTVNYVVGIEQKPFIFEAADMNNDLSIDVLDVIGIVQAVLNPSAAARVSIESMPEAVFTVEDGVLYVETPVTIAGLQVQLSHSDERIVNSDQFATAAGMKGFELASAWLTDNDYLLLGYSFGSKTLEPGKHAVLKLGDGELTSLRLCDTQGNIIPVVAGDATVIKDAMGSKVMNTKGVYNLNGQKMGNAQLKRGVYIINGEKIVK